MTRLDSVIERLQAQRAWLDWAVRAIADIDGPVLEIGLGNGRSYDQLGARLAGTRRILAFDFVLAAHLPPLLRSGAIFLSDQPLETPELVELDPPQGTARSRYHAYRRR